MSCLPEARLKVYETLSSNIVDGTANMIVFVENMDLEEWNNAPTEIHVCIVWDDQNYPAPRQSLAYGKTAVKFDTLLNLYNQGSSFALPYARPSSFHNGGFMVAFADGHVKLVSDSIAYEVYMHLMTSNGRKYQPAGMNNLPPPPPPPATTSNPVQNVFQGVLDQGSF